MKIDRNIPMPAPSVNGRKELAPVESMDVGDSIFFPGLTRVQANGKCRAAAMLAKVPYNFRSAREGDGARVWRVA